MNIAIILSGGVGSRMGLDIPKQYVYVNGKPVIDYCLETFFKSDRIDFLVLGVADEWKTFVKDRVTLMSPAKDIFYAEPGETRQYSIYNAMKVAQNAGAAKGDIVIIHDGARPLVSAALIEHCIDRCNGIDGVMPVIPCKDTVYLSEDGGQIDALLNRNHLWCGQAPEAFEFSKYMKAHEEMPREELLKINGSTELAVKVGLKCQMIPGDPMNFKITTPEDLSNFESIIGGK